MRAPLQEPQVKYLKYLTKILFESTDGFQHLPFLATHLTTLQSWSPEAVPPLACVLLKLSSLDVRQDDEDEGFHKWLHEKCTLKQMQVVCNSHMYVGFLMCRSAKRLQMIRNEPEKRPLHINMRLESYGL